MSKARRAVAGAVASKGGVARRGTRRIYERPQPSGRRGDVRAFAGALAAFSFLAMGAASPSIAIPQAETVTVTAPAIDFSARDLSVSRSSDRSAVAVPDSLTTDAAAAIEGVEALPAEVVSAEAAAPASAVAAPAVPAAPVAPAAETLYTTAALNVRAQATASSALRTTFATGTAVTAAETSGEWRKVAAGDVEGWVLADKLSATKPAEARRPIGRFSQKIQAQDQRWTMMPPTSGPTIAEKAQTLASQPWILPRSWTE